MTQPYSLYWHMYHTVHNINNLWIFHFNQNSTNTIKSGSPVQISSLSMILCVSKKIMHFSIELIKCYYWIRDILTTSLVLHHATDKHWTTDTVKKTIFAGHIYKEISLPQNKKKNSLPVFITWLFPVQSSSVELLRNDISWSL